MSKILPKKDFSALISAYQQHEYKTDRAAQVAITTEVLARNPGVDLNATSQKYGVSLFESLFYGCNNNFNYPVFACLLENGLRPVPPSKNSQGPLVTAAAYNNYELCALFLAHGADPNQISYLDGRTPLFPAVQHNHRSVTKLLLTHGADPNTKIYAPHAPEIHEQPLWYTFTEKTYTQQTCHNKTISVYDALAMISLLREHGLDLRTPYAATGENFSAYVANRPQHPDYKELTRYVERTGLTPPRGPER